MPVSSFTASSKQKAISPFTADLQKFSQPNDKRPERSFLRSCSGLFAYKKSTLPSPRKKRIFYVNCLY